MAVRSQNSNGSVTGCCWNCSRPARKRKKPYTPGQTRQPIRTLALRVTRRAEKREQKMIYVHSLGRALRFYPGRTALARDGRLLTFRELHSRVEGIAATLTSRGFGVGDRLALLLPNGPDYIELVYACSMLGVIAVPLNIRLSAKEIDGALEDARPHGIVRHSSVAVPRVPLSWQQVIDQEPLAIRSDPALKIF